MELSNVQIGRCLSVRTSPCGRRSPERLLEGAGSGLGTVTDQVGNLRKDARVLGFCVATCMRRGDVVHDGMPID
jgi:hypothetical protein